MKNNKTKTLRDYDKEIINDFCKKLLNECLKHMELIDCGSNTGEFMITSWDLIQCMKQVKGDDHE